MKKHLLLIVLLLGFSLQSQRAWCMEQTTIPAQPSLKTRLLSMACNAKNWVINHKKQILIAAITTLMAYVMYTYGIPTLKGPTIDNLTEYENGLFDAAKKCAYPPLSCWNDAAHAYEPFDHFNRKYFNFGRKECIFNQMSSSIPCFEKLNNYLATFSDYKKYSIFRNMCDDFSLAVNFFWKSYFIATNQW